MLLDCKQAAERAAVCERVIRGWIAEGTLPCYRLGRKGSRGVVRIESDDLDGVLASFKVCHSTPKKTPRPKAGPIPKLKYIDLN